METTRNQILAQLQGIYPGKQIYEIGTKFIVGTPDNVEITEEIRWPIIGACFKNTDILDKCQYVIKFIPFENTIEETIYNKLKYDNITPKLIDTWESTIYDYFRTPVATRKMMALLLEKYDGDVYDLLRENITDEQRQLIFKTIIEKNLKLNFNYGIRHGDFHTGNVVYRKRGNITEIRFIDFELSSIYDENHRLVQTGITDGDTKYFDYNPYYDLLAFVHGLYGFNIHIEFPAENTLHYLSLLGEADFELLEETRKDNYDKPNFIFNI